MAHNSFFFLITNDLVGDWGLGTGEMGKIFAYDQLPITNYQLPMTNAKFN